MSQLASSPGSLSRPSAPLEVIAIPCLRDNYAYLLVNDAGEAAVVDPGEARPIQRVLRERGLILRAILNTHHHHDHVGGNARLFSEGVQVFASRYDEARVPLVTNLLDDGDEFSILGETCRVLHVPGHTLGALTYVFEGFAFTGDTLFCAGCGRLFEGSAAQMYASFQRIKQAIPEDYVLYTGHEYTEANLKFALSLLPEDELTQERLKSVQARRALGQSTAAATLATELATNPFFRASDPDYSQALGLTGRSPEEVFAELRARKDQF